MSGFIRYCLQARYVIYFVTLLLVGGGIISFFQLGQLEDPVFSIKTAVVSTQYPGASPREVELEVTDRLETAIQEMPQLKHLYSISRAGESLITVDIKEQYWSDQLPQIWDELRKKVEDVARNLPPGAEKPRVHDDFGFVYGFLLAVTGDGFTEKELEAYSKTIKKELSLVQGVSRVELWGVQKKVVYLDVSEQQLAELRLTPETVGATLDRQNMVVDSGFIDDAEKRFRIAPTGEFTSPEEIGELILRPLPNDIITNAISAMQEGKGSIEDLSRYLEDESANVIRVRDVAKIRPGYKEPSLRMMRFDGQQAIGIQIAGADDANIVDVGEALYKRLDEIMPYLPVGIEIHKVAWQSDLVDEAVSSFLWSLLLAVIIVLIVLIIPSGLRMGLIIGIDLILTILGTFIVMAILKIPLQRMSLGALIIALGMMVDNSIVVADAVAVRIRQGLDRTKAAFEAARENAFPLFAATIVAVMTFYPIYASKEDAGEYCRTLFIVVATALILSWLIAMGMTPIQCLDLLPRSLERKSGGKEEFSSPLFRFLRKCLVVVIRVRFLTLFVLLGLLAAAVIGFGSVRQMFFPDSTRPQLMIDYWADAGTRIENVADEVHKIEEELMKSPYVANVTTFVGSGPPRFYLPVEPERPYSNYAQLIVNLNDYEEVDPLIAKMEPWTEDHILGAMVRFRKYGVGPSNAWKFEARISGPGEADFVTLKEIADEVKKIASASPYGRDWKTDMQNPVLKVVPEFDQKRGRWSNVSRLDLANATKRGYDGRTIGLYREGDDLYPIVLRNIDREREDLLTSLDTLQVKPSESTNTVPLSQVVRGVETKWEDPLIIRWNRRRAVTVQGAPREGVTFQELYEDVIDEINKIKLPPGYEIFWKGEYDSTVSAKASLVPGIIPAVVIILLLLVSVFNSARPVFIILLTIPFAAIGITLGLLVFQIPFGFMALLGSMSLAGMMNKNIVVLLDAAEINLKSGMSRYRAIIEASVSRTRPVLLAAGTTILGVVPLLPDIFWVSMAVTIMAGLAFGSILTLVAVPVFYSILYRVKREDE